MVTYTDRRGSGKTALSQETAEVTADPIVNAPPRFRGDSSWSVKEGPAGGAVGAPTFATDRDNDTLTYGIQPGQNAALFEIDPDTGQVRLAQALDFETTPGPLFFYLTLHDGKDADGKQPKPFPRSTPPGRRPSRSWTWRRTGSSRSRRWSRRRGRR